MLYTREPSFWTAENIAKLCKLWDEKKTTIEIARTLGCNKNQVISAAHRYGCAPRPSPLRRNVASGEGRA